MAFWLSGQAVIMRLSAGRALKKHAGDHLSAREIAKAALETAGEICVYTNDQITLEELE